MGNTQSAFGQLGRAGVQAAPMQKGKICPDCGNPLSKCSCKASKESSEGGPGSGPKKGSSSAEPLLTYGKKTKKDWDREKDADAFFGSHHGTGMSNETKDRLTRARRDARMAKDRKSLSAKDYQNKYGLFGYRKDKSTSHGKPVKWKDAGGYLVGEPQKESLEGGPGSGPRKGASEPRKRSANHPSVKKELERLSTRSPKEVAAGYRKSGMEYMQKTGRLPSGGFSDRSRAIRGEYLRKHPEERPKEEESRSMESCRIITHPLFEKRLREQDTKSPDKQKTRVYLVTIIEEGLGNSKDKNYYGGDALKKSIQLFNGAKCYADHPDAIEEKALPERSMKDVVGWYSNCFTDANPKTGKVRLRGKLHIFPSASWLTEKIDTILENPDAPKDLFGISINAVGKTRPATMDGQQVNYVEEFQRVDSADVVTEPAARGGFDKMLESKRGGLKVTKGMGKRLRETAVKLDPKDVKTMADSLVSAHQSDNPDEMKQALYETSKKLYAASSISGEGPGQVNEELYSNTTPNTEGDREMKQIKVRKVKASVPGGRMLRRKKRFQASAGTGPDNEDLGEPSEGDIPGVVKESDADEEEGGDLGAVDDFGDSSKFKKNSEAGRGGRRRSRMVAEADEDEGFEDEGMEDEDEDENMGGGAMPPAMGGGAGSQMNASEEADEDEDGASDPDGDGDEDSDEDGVDDDLGMDESEEGEEDEAEEDEDEAMESLRINLPKHMKASRQLKKGKEAGMGGFGKAGKASLPSHAAGDYNEDYADGPSETNGGAGKSYQIKTSVAGQNKLARKIVHEANRRIAALEKGVARLRESRRAADRTISRYQGIVRFHNTKIEARKLLESAIREEILPEGYAQNLERDLWGLGRKDQLREIRKSARLLESTRESVVGKLRESGRVDGIGRRGFDAFGGTEVQGRSDVAQDMVRDGIPMKKQR